MRNGFPFLSDCINGIYLCSYINIKLKYLINKVILLCRGAQSIYGSFTAYEIKKKGLFSISCFIILVKIVPLKSGIGNQYD
jgi:hypothetical protein